MSTPKLPTYRDLQEDGFSVLSFITVVGKEKAKDEAEVEEQETCCRLKVLSSLLLDSWGRWLMLTFQETC